MSAPPSSAAEQSFRAALDAVNNTQADMSEEPPARRSPAKPATRGRGRGGRAAKAAGRVAKPAKAPKAPKPAKPAKPAKPVKQGVATRGPGRGRQKKEYSTPKLQAAYERVNELKANFAAVSKALKPAVLELADRTLAQLADDPSLVTQHPRFQETQDFLRERLQDTIDQADRHLKTGLEMAQRVYDNEREAVRNSYNVSAPPHLPTRATSLATDTAWQTQIAELCEDRYGELLHQLDVIEHLYDNDLPLEVSLRCPFSVGPAY